MRAQFIASSTLQGIRRNLSMVVSVILSVAVSLFLAGFAFLLIDQVQVMKGYWYDKVEVTVYLCELKTAHCPQPATEAEKRAVETTLYSLKPLVEKVYYESQDEAYQHFKQDFRNQPDLVRNTDPSALPDSYRVKLSDPRRVAAITSAVAALPGVDQVYDAHRVLGRLFAFLDGLRTGALIVAAIAGAASLLMIVNTTRLAFFGRRREVGIMRLVGASNFYIELPFLTEGALAGVVGALLAFGGLAAIKRFFFGWLQQQLTFTRFIGWDAVITKLPWLFLAGAVLATLTAWGTLRRQLRV